MRVRMKTSMAGPAVRRLAGGVYDVDDAEALRLIGKDFAELLEQTEVKTATEKRASKKAVAPRRQRGRRKSRK